MKTIDITQSKPIESVLEIEIGPRVYIDLHGESTCFEFSETEEEASFLFANDKVGSVTVLFKKPVIIERSGEFSPGCTLDNLYRGRVLAGDRLIEFGEAGEAFFYISFIDPDFELTIKTKAAYIKY
jgi:hypothetical protein